MKKALLLGTVLCISLGVTGCNQGSEKQEKEEPQIKQEEQFEEDALTDEEIDEINKNVEKALNENVKYTFGKVINIQGTKIEIELLSTPEGYDDKGYNDDLDIDISKLKEINETTTIDLIGITSNILPEELKNVKSVRIGTYESDEKNDNTNFEQGQIISLDRIN